MVDRRASVALELHASQFKAESITVAKKIDDIDDQVEKLDRDITKIPADAAKAGAAMRLLGGDVGSVGNRFGSLGDKSTALSVVDAKIRQTRTEVRKLGDEFVRTGDVDVFRKLGTAEHRLRGLGDTRKRLAASLVDGVEDAAKVLPKTLAKAAPEAGMEFGKLFSGGLTGALSTPVLGPIVAGALVAGIAAEIPLVLSAIGGLVVGAGALGAVGAGIVGAIMGDPHDIAEAWRGEIEKLKDQWVNASRSFKGPLVDGAHEFGRAMAEVHIDVALQKAATYLPELIRGAAGLASHLGKGLGVLTDSAGPVMKVMALELPKIGMAFEAAFTSIGRGSEGGAQALKDLLQFTERVIVAVGELIGFAERAYGAMAKFRDLVIPRSWLFAPDGAEGIHGTARALTDFGDGADTAKWAALNLGDAIASGVIPALDDLRNKALGMGDANLALAEGWFRLEKELADGERTLNTNKEAGVQNAEAILQQIKAAERLRQQTYETTGSQTQANAVYDAAIVKIKAMAEKYHFSAEQVDALITALTGVPPVTSAAVKTPGLVEAGAAAAGLAAKLNGLDGRVIDIYTAYHTSGAGQSRLPGMAAGGPVTAGASYIIGEHRPEVFTPTVSGTIIPSVSQFRSAGQMGGGGANITVKSELSFKNPGASPVGLESAVISWLHRAMRDGQLQISSSAITDAGYR